MNVNRSQIEYERRGSYLNKSYSDLFNRVYNNAIYEFLSLGSICKHICLEHHIKIYNLYRNYFLPYLNSPKEVKTFIKSGKNVYVVMRQSDLKNEFYNLSMTITATDTGWKKMLIN